jgi:glycosyltransferase involved in cell wall biosynthesis
MTRVCLITTGQPTTNPRLVKEADALVEAGYDVHVIASFWASWAEKLDQELLQTRGWTCSYAGGSPTNRRDLYFLTRGRHGLSNRLKKLLPQLSVLQTWSMSRVLPELVEQAERRPADLYIGHNLGALPAALAASQKHAARLGFDLEDFYSDHLAQNGANSAIEKLEREALPHCDYLTAAVTGIAQAYAEKYKIVAPETILNVFPLADRPDSFRQTDVKGPLTLYWFSQTIGAGRGLDDVVKAMGAMPERNVQLHLRGAWQAGFKSRLYQTASEHGVSQDRIHAHDPASAQEMVRLSSAYDVGLSLEPPVTANRDLCMSNKIFTYLLAGNAVAVTNTHGHRWIVDQIGPAAISYDAGDFRTLAQKLERWSNDRDSLEHARRTAWRCGAQQFNWDTEKRKFVAIVERVLAGKRSDARQAVAVANR